MTSTRCRWCAQYHKPRFLCDPAKKILDALYARGMEGNMPSIEFPEPIPASQLGRDMGLGDDTRLVQQFVVQGATVPVAGVYRPGLIFTGRDAGGEVLPKWVYFGADDEMHRLVALVSEMASLAVRTAARQRESGTT